MASDMTQAGCLFRCASCHLDASWLVCGQRLRRAFLPLVYGRFLRSCLQESLAADSQPHSGLLRAKTSLSHANFGVCAVYLAERLADFSYGGVGSDGINDVWHGVSRGDFSVGRGFGFLRGSFFQSIKRSLDFVVGAAGTQGFQLGALLAGDGLIDVQNVWRLFLDGELVHSDDDFFVRFDGALVLIG